jgi:outer membrane receptor protein involved in Fe transport
LPNALVSDPPLHQVITRTWEAGLRGQPESRIRWNIGWFRAQNHNDILFVASQQTGNGYFKNFGQTGRQGAEVNVNSGIGRYTLGGGYTFLDATYQSTELIGGSSNSANDTAESGARGFDGTIEIRRGNWIPLVPQHLLKAFADVQVTSKLLLDLNLVAVSRSYARGNENNLHQPDGAYYLGPGTSPGYGVLNLGGRYQLHRRVQLFAQIDNILNHHYYTATQLGATGFTDSGTFIARPFPAVGGNFPIVHATFYAPGAPTRAWGGMRFTF